MTIQELAQKIKSLKSAVVFSHTRPDGDTIGAGLAMHFFLKANGIEASLVCESAIPEKYQFLEGIDQFTTTVDTNAQSYIAVDSANSFRLGNLRDIFVKTKKRTFNIDHHVANDLFATENFVVNTAASTSEIIAQIFQETNCQCPPIVATYMLMGIISDTGNFAHKNVTQKTLEMTAFLVGKGGDIHTIQYNLFKKQSIIRANLFASTIANIRYEAEDKIAFMLVSQENLKKTNATPDLSEGFIDYAMTIDTVEVGVCLLETGKNRFKISLRSKGKVNVNAIAGIFGGGGHILASGCMLFGRLEEVIEKLIVEIVKVL